MKVRRRLSFAAAWTGTILAAATASAQCQGGNQQGGGSSGSTAAIASSGSPFTQNSSAYTQNPFNAANQTAMAAYSHLQQAAALQNAKSEQARLASLQVKYQTHLAQYGAKELQRQSAEKRRQMEDNAAEARALKEERLAARRNKKERVESSSSESRRYTSAKST